MLHYTFKHILIMGSQFVFTISLLNNTFDLTIYDAILGNLTFLHFDHILIILDQLIFINFRLGFFTSKLLERQHFLLT